MLDVVKVLVVIYIMIFKVFEGWFLEIEKVVVKMGYGFDCIIGNDDV